MTKKERKTEKKLKKAIRKWLKIHGYENPKKINFNWDRMVLYNNIKYSINWEITFENKNNLDILEV